MFNLSYSAPCEIQGEIKTKRPIYMSGLGVYTDVDGKKWDVRGIFGTIVQAKPLDQLHSYYTDTSGRSFGLVSETWKPYRNVVVE